MTCMFWSYTQNFSTFTVLLNLVIKRSMWHDIILCVHTFPDHSSHIYTYPNHINRERQDVSAEKRRLILICTGRILHKTSRYNWYLWNIASKTTIVYSLPEKIMEESFVYITWTFCCRSKTHLKHDNIWGHIFFDRKMYKEVQIYIFIST